MCSLKISGNLNPSTTHKTHSDAGKQAGDEFDAQKHRSSSGHADASHPTEAGQRAGKEFDSQSHRTSDTTQSDSSGSKPGGFKDKLQSLNPFGKGNAVDGSSGQSLGAPGGDTNEGPQSKFSAYKDKIPFSSIGNMANSVYGTFSPGSQGQVTAQQTQFETPSAQFSGQTPQFMSDASYLQQSPSSDSELYSNQALPENMSGEYASTEETSVEEPPMRVMRQDSTEQPQGGGLAGALAKLGEIAARRSDAASE